MDKVRIQLLNEETGDVVKEVDVLTSADAVTFSDGETFQQKLDAGKLKGATGAQGPKGDTGATGAQGPKGDTGATGVQGPKGDAGTRGSAWYSGTNITGTSTTATIFSSSGITEALVNDRYFNPNTGNVYKCTVAGNASVAKWTYEICLKGATGAQGPKGDTGATGAQGPKGDTGATGAQGPKGDTGATGAQGPKGDKGDPGDAVKVGTSYSTGTSVKLFFKEVN